MKCFRTICLVTLALLMACTAKLSPTKDQFIAKVNGDSVPLNDYILSYQQLKNDQDDISQKNPKLMDQLKTRAFNDIVLVGLLRIESRKHQITIAKEEIEGRLANWKDGYPPGGFEEMLKKRNTTEEFLKKRIEDQLLTEKLTRSLFKTETAVSDEEIKLYYKQHENEWTRPERVHAFQIVVPTREEAEKIRQEIVSKKQLFESLARQHSISPDAASGGDLGFYSRHERIPAFDEAFGVLVGAISKPIQSRYGFHLLKVAEKQPSKKLSFQDAKEEIIKSIRRQKEMAVYKEWVTKLLRDSEIYRNEALYVKIQ